MTVRTETGDTYQVDLFIGLDGLKSVVRHVLFPDVQPRVPMTNVAYQALIPYEALGKEVPEVKELFKNSTDA